MRGRDVPPRGIGPSQDVLQRFFEARGFILTRDADQLKGCTSDQHACVWMSGLALQPHTITLAVSILDDHPDITERNGTYLGNLLALLFPGWDEGATWLQEAWESLDTTEDPLDKTPEVNTLRDGRHLSIVRRAAGLEFTVTTVGAK